MLWWLSMQWSWCNDEWALTTTNRVTYQMTMRGERGFPIVYDCPKSAFLDASLLSYDYDIEWPNTSAETRVTLLQIIFEEVLFIIKLFSEFITMCFSLMFFLNDPNIEHFPVSRKGLAWSGRTMGGCSFSWPPPARERSGRAELEPISNISPSSTPYGEERPSSARAELNY